MGAGLGLGGMGEPIAPHDTRAGGQHMQQHPLEKVGHRQGHARGGSHPGRTRAIPESATGPIKGQQPALLDRATP